MKLPVTNRKQASAIVVVLSVTVTVAMIVAVAMEYTASIRRNVQRSEALQSAIAIGDGALESVFSSWRATSRLQTNVALNSNAFKSIPLPTADQFPNVSGFTSTRAAPDLTLAHAPTISNFQVTAVDPQLNPIDDSVSPIPGTGQSSNSATWYYLAQADVTLPALRNNITAKVRRVFQKEQLSPWNWAIFYVDALEIQPGALMNITGWVHTNSDLYTGHNLLHFGSKVTYGSDWTVGFNPGDSRAPGGSSPEIPTAPTYVGRLPPAYDVAHQPFGLDATLIFNTGDTNPNNDSYHELIEPPKAGYTDPLLNKRYWDQADVVIQVNGSNTVTIGRPNDDGTITAFTSIPSSDANYAKYQALYSMFNTSGAIVTNQSIQDNREKTTVRLVTLDLSRIQNGTGGLSTSYKANTGGNLYFNGIVYIYDSSATASLRRGVRLKNGSKIPITGLTIASNNPVYIQGDYNSGRDYDGNPAPPSNSGNASDAAMPQVSNYNGVINSATKNGRAPCSVIADAVTILSNNWNDANAQSDEDIGGVAAHTTVNTAIVAGIVPSANNYYSGGAENFPRFLEDWKNKKITYYGSMVELYKSAQSIGRWGSDNVYEAPTRQWYFDTNLQINTPPGSLLVYSYVKGRWFLAQ